MNSLVTLVEAMENQQLFYNPSYLEDAAVQTLGRLSARVIKKTLKRSHCLWCKALSTPLWRKGPYTSATLCNACGTRFIRCRKAHPTLPVLNIIELAMKALQTNRLTN